MTFCKFLFLSILLFTSSAFSQEKVYSDLFSVHIGKKKYRFSGIDTPEMKQTCSKDNTIIMCACVS